MDTKLILQPTSELSKPKGDRAIVPVRIGAYRSTVTADGDNSNVDQSATEQQYRWVETFDVTGCCFIFNKHNTVTGYTSSVSQQITYLPTIKAQFGSYACAELASDTDGHDYVHSVA
jgi:hypothetical protein